MGNSIKSVVARREDYDKVLSVLVETANWLKEKGSDQWSDLLRGVDVHRTDQAIEKQNVYIVYSDEALLGVFILLEEQSAWDAQLWGRETSDDIVYLHRVALGHQVHGKGSGKELVKAAIKVAKNKEKKIVRLDCISTNQYLNHFYSSIGFLLVEEHKRNEPHSQSSFNLYEKRL